VKKVVVVVCAVAIILLTVPTATFAADALYRMLHGDVESFKQDQDAFIVGQLIDKQRGKFTVKGLKVLSGKVNADSILVSDDFTYGWDIATPKVNDFCVFSLKKTGDYYKKAWGIFKATSGDYNTLTLEPLNAPTPGLLGDLACIQWYVNSGGTENDFYFNSSTAYVRRPNGPVQLYPLPATETQTVEYKDAMNQIQNTQQNNSNFSFAPLIGAVVLIGIGTGAFVILRKGKVG